MVRVVTALSGLVLIVLALRLAMAPLFPLDKFVAPAVAVFEADTGTVVKLGSADLTLLPTPTVVATDVTIELPDGFGEVHASRLLLDLNPLPFLSGSAELGNVTVERPVVRLKLQNGDLDPARVVSTFADLARRASSRRFLATDGRLIVSAGSIEASLTGLTASAGRFESSDRLVLKAMLHETPLSLTMEAGSSGATRILFTTPTMSAGLDGGLAGGAFAGRFDLSVPDVAVLGGPFSALSGEAALKGAMTLSSDRLEMVDASATALGSGGRLSAAIDLGASRPSIDVRTDFRRLTVGSVTDLAALFAWLGFDPLAGKAPFDAGLEVKLAELILPASQMRNVHLTAVNREGSFGAVVDATLGKGTLSSRFDLVSEGDGRRLGASVIAKDVEAADLVATTGAAASPITGSIAGDLRLSAHGRSNDELAATLAVDGEASLRGGAFGGLSFAGNLKLPALTNISGDLSIVGLDKSARLAGQATSPSGIITLQASAEPRRLMEGGAAPVDVQLEGPAFSAGFEGGIDPVVISATGNLTLSSRRLQALLGIAGLPESASLDGQLDATLGRQTLTDAHLLLGDTALSGLLDLSNAGERNRLTGRMTGDVVDVVALAGATADALSTPGGWLGAVDTDLHIDAGRITAGPIAAAGGQVDIRLNDKRGEVELSKLLLGGGNGAATLTVKSADRPIFALTGKLDGARLASLAPIVGTMVDGELSLAADVSAEGAKRGDLFKAATGTIDFSVVRGLLNGLDPMALMKRLARAVQTDLGPDPGRVGFDRLSGRLKLAKGSVTSDDLAFGAGDLQLSGSGSVGIGSGALDLRLKPRLKGYPDFEAPVAVVGSFSSPRLYPDLPGLADDPTSGYVRLGAMNGGFARLIGGDAAPKLETVGPDAMTSMIDKMSDSPQPPVVSEPPVAPAVETAPLPLARPAGTILPLRPQPPAPRPPVLAGGPLDLQALGRASGNAPRESTRASSCRPGRDGRCIP